ncbi:hypothetical protein JOL79_29535 [Microbispora sp. RL4-1S]|uniref:HTH luxR-type domain-containing protein n=1 Tax=Microbispora oryzae TaxID=2806554 RepID=A0A940WLP4_9ACTN|nr:hypothetical protein [Microbispora oryzae]MBP2707930.1 hypothetical protein [Microbispora oryzae]
MTMTTMSAGSFAAGGDYVTDVYRYASRRGAIDGIEQAAADLGVEVAGVARAVEHLLEIRLLRVADDVGRRFEPVDPQLAAASLVSSVEREIYLRRELIDQIRERVGVFQPDWTGAVTAAPGAAVDYLVGAMEVRGFLKTAGDACREEVLVLQTGSGGADDLVEPFLALLARGVAVRIICQHRNRGDVATRMRLKRLTDAGAVIYTLSHIPRSALVFDRSLVVMFGMNEEEVSVARVHNQGIAQFFLDMFNHMWETATPLEGVGFGYADVADDLQQAIAALMAKGYTDEVVARKLGMSVRSCRRHIGTLMRDLDATSRFQAGVQAARRFLPSA